MFQPRLRLQLKMKNIYGRHRAGCFRLPKIKPRTDVKVDKIESDTEGFSLYSGSCLLERIGWDQVVKIVAYKRDHITIDLIYLDILLSSGRQVTLNEFMIGFELFTAQLDQALGDVVPDWWIMVAHPPFERNETVLYRKKQ